MTESIGINRNHDNIRVFIAGTLPVLNEDWMHQRSNTEDNHSNNNNNK